MSRILQRAATIVAGMALPIGAWALVAPSNVGGEYVGIVQDAPIASEMATAGVDLPEVDEFEVDAVRADSPDRSPDSAVRPENATTGCCIWIYIGGRWYCFPCV